ncbi:MAG: DUF6351 family protein [Gammaproteobacteria bacterium]
MNKITVMRIRCWLILAVLAGCSPEPQAPAAPLQSAVLALDTLSNEPHLLSGGDTLLEIFSSVPAEQLSLDLPPGASHGEMVAAGRNGELDRHVTLLRGLPLGESEIRVVSGRNSAALEVTNYSINGPIFSGEQQQPYICLADLAPNNDGSKRRFAIGNGDYLDDTALDRNCTLPGRLDYVYFSIDSGFKPLPDPATRPSDLAFTTTNEGREVPFIVRIETGTINRAIYQIAILHDPATAEPSPMNPSANWNSRLVYTFGGGCESGYFQGTATGGVLQDYILARGFAVASSTLNVNAQGGCNDVVSAETAMMVKEHFIDSYGLPRYTIGRGGSGGAMQQLLIAGAYPGILNGLIPSNTFADATTYFTDSQECAGILRDFVNDPARGLDEATKNAIGGWSMWSTCEQSLGERPKRIGPGDCPAAIPTEAAYDPVNNPDGARCSIYDGMRNIFGERLYSEISSERAFARAPHDNVGVQYGLAALNAGLIDRQLFLDLNENIGGWDIDVNSRPQRTEGDPEAIRIAYETGRVTSGAAGLSMVPIIDDRGYLDDIGNFHASVYSFVTRARLLRDNGHANNYVLRRHHRDLDLMPANLDMMDEWLASIGSDSEPGTMLERVVRNKPANLQSDCFASNGERIVEEPSFNMDSLFDNTAGACNSLYPPHAGLRLVAGGPLSNDVFKCQLKPIDFADYEVEFTAAEKSRLQSIFPQGVCDWSKPGVNQTTNQTWLSFGPSPVNKYGEQQ